MRLFTENIFKVRRHAVKTARRAGLKKRRNAGKKLN